MRTSPCARARRRARLITVILVVLAAVATACSSPPESPWAQTPDVDDLRELDDPVGSDTEATPGDDGAAEGDHAILTDTTCVGEEVRCGLASVPQTTGAVDRVTLEYRVIVDEGDGTPVVHLLEGFGEDLLTADEFPDRPLVGLGSRGVAPGRPNLSCPEFRRALTNADVGAVLAECIDRLGLAGIDPAGTLPSQLGADAGRTIAALGYDEVDLVVPGWRALTVPGIADHVDVRRVVYLDPWLATDRSVGPALSTHASIDAVWARCAEIATCAAPGTADDFLDAIAALDDQPLDDTRDTVADPVRPIDAMRLMGAVVASVGRSADLAFLPEIHRALLARDADTISAFVQRADTASTDVGLLGVSCTLFAPGVEVPGSLPSPLREDAADGIEVFDEACAVWPAEAPLPGAVPALTVFTRSTPVGGPDHDAATAVGPVIIEPTVGPPSPACARAVAVAWFGRGEVDDGACTTPLAIGSRGETAASTPGVYDTGDVTVELAVPDTWADSGTGTWWREADPLDPTNLDVYVWESDDAETARRQIVEEWGVLDPELTSTQVDDGIWLLATGASDLGTVYRIAVGRIGDRTIAVVLETTADEAGSLADEVLLPALSGMVVG